MFYYFISMILQDCVDIMMYKTFPEWYMDEELMVQVGDMSMPHGIDLLPGDIMDLSQLEAGVDIDLDEYSDESDVVYIDTSEVHECCCVITSNEKNM